MQPETLRLIVAGGHKKGDVLAVARIAGIMAAKKNAELIPLCHRWHSRGLEVELAPMKNKVWCCVAPLPRPPPDRCRNGSARGGADRPAHIYDMCKAGDRRHDHYRCRLCLHNWRQIRRLAAIAIINSIPAGNFACPCFA